MRATIDRIAKEFIDEAQASPRMFEDLAAMEKYMAESYDGRAFVEILQNADDAYSTKVEVFSCGDDFIVANNGRPFSEADIVSICRSGASSKQRGNGIGYRGVGFKSATSISTEIVIHSSNSFFTFSKSECARFLNKSASQVPTVRIPFPISPNTIPARLHKAIDEHKEEGYTTFFIFMSANKEKLCDELRDVNSGWMLFLNHVNEIKIAVERIQTTFSVKRIPKRESQTLVSFIGTKEKWLTIADGEGASIAFRYDTEILPCSPEDALFHCYLPTLDSLGLPFKANADFSTDPSRKHVIVSDELTKRNIGRIAELVYCVITDSKDDYWGAKVIDLLSSRVGISEAATILERQVLVHLYEDAWLPLKDGRRIIPKDYKVMPEWIDAKTRKAIFTKVPSLSKYEVDDAFIHNTSKLDSLLLKTGAAYYSLEEYVQILCNASLVSILNDQILGKLWGYAFRSACYVTTALGDCYLRDTGKQLAPLKNAKMDAPLPADFLNSIEAVLSSDEIDKLVSESPAFSLLKKAEKATKQMRTPVRQGKEASTGLSKWKTPIQNCIAAESLVGYSGKDVSRKGLGYDVVSTNASGEMRYITVKEVTALGDSFVLSESEYSFAQIQESSYFVFIVTHDDPEHQHQLISQINKLTFDKRVREWEYLCSTYEITLTEPSHKEYPIDSSFMKEFSLKYLNKLQVTFLIALCNGIDLVEFQNANLCKTTVLVNQINSIADFYIGFPLLMLSDDGIPSINEKYIGSVMYMIKDQL